MDVAGSATSRLFIRFIAEIIFFAGGTVPARFSSGLSDGVMVAQGSLEAFVMVRIHVGQPTQTDNRS